MNNNQGLREKLVSLAQELIRVNSSNPPGYEKGVADILAGKLKEIGLEIEYFEKGKDRPNIAASWKGEGEKKLILHGHMDTIPVKGSWEHEPFSGEIENGKLYGRGAADMKGSLAAMVCAIRQLKEDGWKPKGELMFLGCVNEEMGDRDEIGMRWMANKVKGDLILIGDDTDFNIVIAEKGVLWLEIISRGREAHSSMPWEGINAIVKLGKFLIELNNMKFLKRSRLLGTSTLSIGTIDGGYKTNAVPRWARASVDIRFVPGEKKDDILKRINEILEEMKREDKDMNIEINEIVYYNPVEVPAENPNIELLKSVIAEKLGREIEIKGEHSATGAGFFIRAGTPAIICGPGKPETGHTRDEHIEISDLEKACEIYKEFIKRFFG